MEKKLENLTDDELYDLMTEELLAAIGWTDSKPKKRSKGAKKNSKKEKRIVQKTSRAANI